MLPLNSDLICLRKPLRPRDAQFYVLLNIVSVEYLKQKLEIDSEMSGTMDGVSGYTPL